MPLTATIRPSARAAAAAATGSAPSPGPRPRQRRSAVAGRRWSGRGTGGRRDRGTRRRRPSHIGKLRHRGGRPVVGQVGDDGVARPAVGAGDERVPVSAVGRVAQLAQAVGADRDVRRHQGAPRSAPRAAVDDLETRCRPVGATVVTATLSMRAIGGGRLRDRRRRRRRPHSAAPSNSQCTEPGVVVDEPRDAVSSGNPRDGRPESDTLHHAGDVEAHPHASPDASRELLMDLLSSSDFRVDGLFDAGRS